MAPPVEYKVLETREGLFGGKMSGEKVERLLDECDSRTYRRATQPYVPSHLVPSDCDHGDLDGWVRPG
jgi:hypothetical protein